MKKNVVYLDITCWNGLSIGAEHYYGKLIGHDPDYKTVELRHRLSSKEAKYLNKKDRVPAIISYRAGQEDHRFETEEQVIEVALSVWNDHFPDGEVLILGSSSTAEPQKILYAPETIMKKGNALFEEQEKIGWVERYGFRHRPKGAEEKLDNLYKQWKALGL